MFEDFENRMGFWKNLGSNFTINYSGDAPSFMTDSEMWQSMDSGTTQTLAAWENGWVLTNNPDGTITANPKYTSGLPSETLTKVPVGFAPPTNTTPTDAGGGVVVAFNNEENESTDCAEQRRINKVDGSCGDCLEGYIESNEGKCFQPIDANALLPMVGLFTILVVIFAPLPYAESLFKKK